MNDEIHSVDSEILVTKEIKSRSRTIPAPKSIADAMSGLLAKRGYAQTHSAAEIQDAWQKVVGPQFAGRTVSGKIRSGVLEVVVANSTILQELTFEKEKLLNDLVEIIPEKNIQDLRFRIGPAN